LHDVVGLAFTNIIGMMNAVIKKPFETPEEQRELYEWIRETSQTGLKNTRAILYELRAISEPRPQAVELVNRVVKAFRSSTNTEVKIEWGNLPFHLPSDHTTAIIHLLQEALVNSFRHGKATYIEVHFKVLGSDLRVAVVDNGRGGPTDQYGIGQNGMLERIHAVGGRVSFGTTPAGYRVDASMPIGTGST
jgi:signal transduction histidine kinase